MELFELKERITKVKKFLVDNQDQSSLNIFELRKLRERIPEVLTGVALGELPESDKSKLKGRIRELEEWLDDWEVINKELDSELDILNSEYKEKERLIEGWHTQYGVVKNSIVDLLKEINKYKKLVREAGEDIADRQFKYELNIVKNPAHINSQISELKRIAKILNEQNDCRDFLFKYKIQKGCK